MGSCEFRSFSFIFMAESKCLCKNIIVIGYASNNNKQLLIM